MRMYLTTSSRLGTADNADHGEPADLMVLEAGSAGITERVKSVSLWASISIHQRITGPENECSVGCS